MPRKSLKKSLRKSLKNNTGFTLIELAIVILIGGVLTLGAVKFALPLYEKAKRLETNEKMRVVNEAIEAYALKNYRIPCPADPRTTPTGGEPNGAERFSGAAGDIIPANCSATAGNWIGAVPYKTLGIPVAATRDSWGNLFTYAISPAFALDTTDASIPVHPVCRTLDWFYPKDATSTFNPRNMRKARFCCASSPGGNNIYAFNTDISVQNRVGGTLTSALAAAAPRQASGNASPNTTTPFNCGAAACVAYAPADQLFTSSPNVLVPVTDVSTGIAYVLVSHGPNRFGAFLASGGQIPGAVSADEIENSDNDRVFVENDAVSDNAANYYDDIVLWRTQDLLLAEQGESCVKP